MSGADAAGAAGAAGRAGPGDGSGRRLLLVDDDQDVARVYARAFVQAGWAVHQAREGGEAIAMVGSHAFEGAVVDVILPRAGGMDVIRAVRARWPACRIVAVTGLRDLLVERLALESGADAFLVKPVDLPALLAALG